MTQQRLPVGGLAALLFLVAPTAVLAQKTDVVVMMNGDHYTCEIKRLERGLLRVKTDDAGTLDIKWHRIASITSPTPFEVETGRGARFVGELRPALRPGSVDLALGGTLMTVEMRDIVFLAPVKSRFLSRLSGSISVGFTFASANNKSDWSLDTNLSYRGVGYENRFTGSSAYSKQGDASPISRNSGAFASERRLKGLWTYSGLLALQQNEELSLKLRVLAGAGVGRIFVQSNRAGFRATGGLAVTREYFKDEKGHTSLESFTQVGVDVFRLDSPKIDFGVTYTLLPSLTDAGRVRSELDASLRVELFFKDFFWGVNGFDSADTKPPQSTTQKHDYGFTTSFGYSF